MENWDWTELADSPCKPRTYWQTPSTKSRTYIRSRLGIDPCLKIFLTTYHNLIIVVLVGKVVFSVQITILDGAHSVHSSSYMHNNIQSEIPYYIKTWLKTNYSGCAPLAHPLFSAPLPLAHLLGVPKGVR